MRLISSPLRYPGGKAKAVAFLAQFFPDFKELREPMCGGASSGFYVLSWKLKYGMTNYRKTYLREGDELLIANFPLKPALSRLLPQPS